MINVVLQPPFTVHIDDKGQCITIKKDNLECVRVCVCSLTGKFIVADTYASWDVVKGITVEPYFDILVTLMLIFRSEGMLISVFGRAQWYYYGLQCEKSKDHRRRYTRQYSLLHSSFIRLVT